MRRFVLGAVCALGVAGQGRAAPVTATAELACGGAVFVARTVYDAHLPPDDGLGYLSQSVVVAEAGGRARVVRVADAPPVRLPGGQKALQAIVQSWACVRGAGGRPYVLVDVACERADLAGACHGQAEWFPVVSTGGERLDRGFTPGDSRYPAFYARLGVTVDGVALRDATGG